MWRFQQLPWDIKASVLILAVLFLMTLLAESIMPYNANAINLLHANRPPFLFGGTTDFVLGTDQLGRDILSRCIYGIRVSAGIALSGLFIGGTIGSLLGIVSGYMGGLWDKGIMSLVDLQLSVPFMLIILMGLAIFGRDIGVLIFFVGIAKWEVYARVVRGLVLEVRHKAFIEAATQYNASSYYIVFRHIVPNIMQTIIILLTLNFPSVIMLEASLSFLGIGVQPPTPTLGRMVADGRNVLMSAWWVSLVPAFIILLASVSVQRMGDYLRDVLDVRFDTNA